MQRINFAARINSYVHVCRSGHVVPESPKVVLETRRRYDKTILITFSPSKYTAICVTTPDSFLLTNENKVHERIHVRLMLVWFFEPKF